MAGTGVGKGAVGGGKGAGGHNATGAEGAVICL